MQRAFELHLSHDAVVEFLGGRPTEVPDHYREADPMRLPIAQAVQVLFVAGNDEDVPPEFSRRYVEQKKAREKATLIEIPKADHFDLIDPRSAAWTKVENEVLKLLKE